ncbi:MAG: tyrosine-type recombinase/integrase, partial [Candidatus Dormibacteraceae bacterium]
MRRGLEPNRKNETPKIFSQMIDYWWENFGTKLKSGSIKLFVEKHLRKSLGPLFEHEVRARLESLLSSKQGQLQPKSINHLRGIVRRIIRVSKRKGLWHGPDPVGDVAPQKVTKRIPDYLRAEEVPLVLAALPPRWRSLFATAIYVGLRRGELLALQKVDVDLKAGTLTIHRSHGADTTKGRHDDLLPIAESLRPYLESAFETSKSELVFPKKDGSRHPPDLDLVSVLRRALGRAGIAKGYIHKCRRKHCGYETKAQTAETGRCPKCKMKLWAKPIVRPIRFHDLRHTTATLLLKEGVPLATVQRLMRHTDPRITSETYGHLDIDDMRKAVNKLDLGLPSQLAAEDQNQTRTTPESTKFAASLLLEGEDPKDQARTPEEKS